MALWRLRPGAFRLFFRPIAFNVGSGALAAYLRRNGAEPNRFYRDRARSPPTDEKCGMIANMRALAAFVVLLAKH
jgi:hypothetical protein